MNPLACHLSILHNSLLLFGKKVGIFIVTSTVAKVSCTSKPLSAIIEPPGSVLEVKLLLSTIWQSLVDPPKAGDTYEVSPPGVTPTKHLAVFLFLYDEKVTC